MKIKKLKLFTAKLEDEKEFFANNLGFKLVNSGENFFSVKVGWSELMFQSSAVDHNYHYCFLIPSNKLKEALIWMEERVKIIDIEKGRKIQHFESWNADSFYFYDASGNLAECIVRYDLKNETDTPFDVSQMLCVNEIGLPSNNIIKTNESLSKLFKTSFYKGDTERFGTNGDAEGIFLLPNYNVKQNWFPTNQKISLEPFDVQIEHEEHEMSYSFNK